MGIVDPGFKEARELTTIKLGCGEANRVFTMTKLQVCIQKVRISSTSKTGDMSDDPRLALIEGTLLSWARINNAEFMSYPDDT